MVDRRALGFSVEIILRGTREADLALICPLRAKRSAPVSVRLPHHLLFFSLTYSSGAMVACNLLLLLSLTPQARAISRDTIRGTDSGEIPGDDQALLLGTESQQHSTAIVAMKPSSLCCGTPFML